MVFTVCECRVGLPSAPCPPPMLHVDEFRAIAKEQDLTSDEIDSLVRFCNVTSPELPTSTIPFTSNILPSHITSTPISSPSDHPTLTEFPSPSDHPTLTPFHSPSDHPTLTTFPSPSDHSASTPGLATATICDVLCVALIVGVIALVLIFVLLMYMLYKRTRKMKRRGTTSSVKPLCTNEENVDTARSEAVGYSHSISVYTDTDDVNDNTIVVTESILMMTINTSEIVCVYKKDSNTDKEVSLHSSSSGNIPQNDGDNSSKETDAKPKQDDNVDSDLGIIATETTAPSTETTASSIPSSIESTF